MQVRGQNLGVLWEKSMVHSSHQLVKNGPSKPLHDCIKCCNLGSSLASQQVEGPHRYQVQQMLAHGKFCVIAVWQADCSLVCQHLSEPALRSQLGGRRSHHQSNKVFEIGKKLPFDSSKSNKKMPVIDGF